MSLTHVRQESSLTHVRQESNFQCEILLVVLSQHKYVKSMEHLALSSIAFHWDDVNYLL